MINERESLQRKLLAKCVYLFTVQAARERELRSRGGEEELEVSRRAWEVNYREAAIFLEEGQNNDKFIHHPRYLLKSVNFF